MHHPPEVRFFVDGSPWPRRLVVMLSTLAVLQVSWFIHLNWTPTWQTAVVGGSLLFAVGLAWFWTRGAVGGSLHWDGVQWQWSGFAVGAAELQRHLDFQTLILGSLHSPGDPPVWLWLQRSQDPYQWLALRRAVVHTTSPDSVHHAADSVLARHIATP